MNFRKIPNKKQILSSILIINTSFFCFFKAFHKKINDHTEKVTHVVWFDIEINYKSVGRFEIGLYGNHCSKIVNNFLNLVEGVNDKNNTKVSYLHSKAFNIIPNFLCCFGDVIENNGNGHFSIYSNEYMNDVIDSNLLFNSPGVVGVCNKGEKNTNGSSFFIILNENYNLNQKYTIIGKVNKGLELIRTISSAYGDVNLNDEKLEIRISDCGIYNFNH